MPRIIVKGETFFQLVLSRRFSQKFSGDDFNVYRALRSINPSPYLFYFDYGGYKIFGSSPEAQLVIKEKLAEIHPIAGTFKRTGNETEDKILAEKLLNDPKEGSEHVMLVDLARNDLSRNCQLVKVEKFNDSSIDILINTFTNTNDWEKYLEIREELVFIIKKVVEGNNSSFAFPSQSIYIEKK